MQRGRLDITLSSRNLIHFEEYLVKIVFDFSNATVKLVEWCAGFTPQSPTAMWKSGFTSC